MLESDDVFVDGGADLGDIGVGHDVGHGLRKTEFVEPEQEGFRLAGKLQQGCVVAGLVGLENRLGFGVESDQALAGKMLDGVVEIGSRLGDHVDPAGKCGQVEQFYFFGRNGLLKHQGYLSEGAIRL